MTPGTMAEASIGDCARASANAVGTSMGPCTRWATISDQTSVSQNATTAMSSERPISSGLRSRCHWTVTRVVTSSAP